MKTKRKTLLIKWFLSYLFILVIPIFLSIGIYAYSLQITKGQANKMNDALMSSVKVGVDNHINEINKLFKRIALDLDVQSATIIKGKFTAKEQLTLYHLVNSLKNLNIVDDFIEDIFIYFNNTGTVSSVNGNMSGELFYHLYYENSEYDFTEFQELMKENYNRGVIPVHKLNGENVLLFTMTTLQSNFGIDSGTIVITINMRSLQKTINNMKWDDSLKIFILNSNNEIVDNTEDNLQDSELEYEKISEGDYFYKKVNNKRYMVSSTQSDYINWKYICMTPDALLEKNAKSIRYFSLVGLFLCIFMGSYFSYFLAKSNYNPLQGIIDLFRKQGNWATNTEQNEYRWLMEEAQHIFKERSDTNRILWNNSKVLKDYYIFRLLEYPFDKENGPVEYNKFNLKLNANYNVVVLFPIIPLEEQKKEDISFEESLSLYKFVVANIFSEIAVDHFNVEIADIGDMVAAIINLPSNTLEMVELLKETIYNLEQKIESFDFQVVSAIGTIELQLEGIHGSYLAAREAAEYIQLLNTDIILYDDIKNLQSKYYYPIEIEQKVINAIKVGDSSAAAGYIFKVLDTNYNENNIAIDMRKCLIFDMLGTLMKGTDLIGCGDILTTIDITRKLSAKLPLSEIKDRFGEIVNEICTNILDKLSENESNNQLSNRVKEFIDKNYQDPDLNISLTGLHFDITPAYISTLFKKQTGDSLLEYINSVRVKEAQKLLEQGISVVDTSQKVGFRNSGAFIRVFKKQTGVTPGQLRKTI
ncbi:MAG: AraC family transcriptional regulator [Herbinix sp.]|jgi:AraC-like DNA-binding protein|nr:AraC family transcriptional regulator [Herbinix sp.]